MSNENSLGKVLATFLNRHLVSDHFDGWLEEGVVLRAETHTGSRYNIELTPNGQSEVFECSEGTFNIRPGSAIVNGRKTVAAFIGFHEMTGTFILLDETRNFLRRSSSMKQIAQIDLVSS